MEESQMAQLREQLRAQTDHTFQRIVQHDPTLPPSERTLLSQAMDAVASAVAEAMILRMELKAMEEVQGVHDATLETFHRMQRALDDLRPPGQGGHADCLHLDMHLRCQCGFRATQALIDQALTGEPLAQCRAEWDRVIWQALARRAEEALARMQAGHPFPDRPDLQDQYTSNWMPAWGRVLQQARWSLEPDATVPRETSDDPGPTGQAPSFPWLRSGPQESEERQ